MATRANGDDSNMQTNEIQTDRSIVLVPLSQMNPELTKPSNVQSQKSMMPLAYQYNQNMLIADDLQVESNRDMHEYQGSMQIELEGSPPEHEDDMVDLQAPEISQAQRVRGIAQFNQDAQIISDNYRDVLHANEIVQTLK